MTRCRSGLAWGCVWALVAGAAAAERDAVFAAEIEARFAEWVALRREFHADPELSNHEVRTAARVADRLRHLGLESVQTGVALHGVVAVLDSGRPGPCVAIRADLDALPIQELRAVPYRSRNDGVMHACGHDVHLTCALGAAEVLARHRGQWRGRVKFLFQPAEEGMPPGFAEDWGAQRMIREGALRNPAPEAIFALHCRPTIVPAATPAAPARPLRAGEIAYALGPDSANSDRFEVVIRGTMAHGSAPHRGVDAIVVAAETITALQTIRSRTTDTRQPLVLSIGTIRGGNRENILADEVRYAGTVRTYDTAFRDEIIEQMHRILSGVTAAHGARYELTYRKGYPSVHNDPPLGEATVASFRRLFGPDRVTAAVPGMGGEDFSYFAQLIPGFYFRLGVALPDQDPPPEIHTPAFDVDEACLKTGVAALAGAACDFLDRAGPNP
jgi:amidohydrolase